MSELLVFIEQDNNEIKESSLELLGGGRGLADSAGLELSAVLLGHNIGEAAKELISYGADKVYSAENEELRAYRLLPYTRVIAELIRKEKPEIFLLPATIFGRELGPRIAARLGTGLTADCTDLKIGNKLLIQIRPASGGDVLATIVTPEHRPQMATVRPGTFSVPKKALSRTGEVVPCAIELKESDKAVVVLETVKGDEGEACFKDAEIIISGGRGIGGPKGLELLKGLAELLGAKVGASRAAVDAGWASHPLQIGMSGLTVRPQIYVACGISGAVQHLTGMIHSKTIIAINIDENAPIFKFAHYGIIGDLFTIIPRLIEMIKEE